MEEHRIKRLKTEHFFGDDVFSQPESSNKKNNLELFVHNENSNESKFIEFPSSSIPSPVIETPDSPPELEQQEEEIASPSTELKEEDFKDELDMVINWIINENLKMDEKRARDEELTDKIFSNYLIASRIYQFLPDQELKDCALVKKNWIDNARFALRKTRRSIVKLNCHSMYSAAAFKQLLSGCSACPFNGISLSCTTANCQKHNIELEFPNDFKLTYLYVNLHSDSCDGMLICKALMSKYLTTIQELYIERLPPKTATLQDFFPAKNEKTDVKNENTTSSSSSSQLLEGEKNESALKFKSLTKLTLPSYSERCRGFVEPNLVQEIIASSPLLKTVNGAILPSSITPLIETQQLDLVHKFHFRVRSIQDLDACTKYVNIITAESYPLSQDVLPESNNTTATVAKKATKKPKPFKVAIKELTFSNCGMPWASIPTQNLRAILSQNMEMLLQRNMSTLNKIEIDPYSLLCLSRLLHQSPSLKLDSVTEMQFNMDVKYDFLLSFFSLRNIDFATKFPKLTSIVLKPHHYEMCPVNLAELMHHLRLNLSRPVRRRSCLTVTHLKLEGQYPVLLVNIIPKMRVLFPNVKHLHIHNQRAAINMSTSPGTGELHQYFFNGLTQQTAAVIPTLLSIPAYAKRQTFPGDGLPMLFKALWSAWIEIESLKFTGVLDENICWPQSSVYTFDNVFTGISPVNCHKLHTSKDYSQFENFQSTLSIRNLKKLTKLEIQIDHHFDLYYGNLNAHRLPELFISEVSGICAFSQMPDLKVVIGRKTCSFTGKKCCLLQLDSVSPFVTINDVS